MNFKWIILLIAIIFSFGCEPAPEEIIEISYPNSTTEWTYLETNTYITYSGGMMFDRLFEIYRDGAYMGIYLDWDSYVIDDPVRAEPLDSDWIPASGYQIKVIDKDDNWGWSDPFSIVEDSSGGSELITISYPEDNTEWLYEQENTFVEWVDATGSQVRFDIYVNNDSLGVYLGWTDNSGFAERNEPLDQWWIPGSQYNYQIKAIDSDGNYGWSDNFSIVEN